MEAEGESEDKPEALDTSKDNVEYTAQWKGKEEDKISQVQLMSICFYYIQDNSQHMRASIAHDQLKNC